jgi:hypothetical protein
MSRFRPGLGVMLEWEVGGRLAGTEVGAALIEVTSRIVARSQHAAGLQHATHLRQRLDGKVASGMWPRICEVKTTSKLSSV